MLVRLGMVVYMVNQKCVGRCKMRTLIAAIAVILSMASSVNASSAWPYPYDKKSPNPPWVLYTPTRQASDSNGDGPGTCLVVDNESALNVTVTVTTPSIYNDMIWIVSRGPHLLTLADDTTIKATNERNAIGGNWSIHYFDNSNSTITNSWRYDVTRNRTEGCNGSWIVTLSY